MHLRKQDTDTHNPAANFTLEDEKVMKETKKEKLSHFIMMNNCSSYKITKYRI